MEVMEFIFSVVLLIIFYLILKSAIRNGINESRLGIFLQKKYGVEEEADKSPLQKEIDKSMEDKYKY
ncbi:hypothetical protein M3202_21010 [Alkalihalobacillus oceani]|uniref:Uncharacterized protein n=1 Tax=Halalkalibacter oceani TaxID=1653776 RepID=A0A9X2DT23_9BACI|nr:hypothetical protein [Halalkalibacter oceani]MCM3716529.1 hypothetical protein [Halalkalibacter oceani]